LHESLSATNFTPSQNRGRNQFEAGFGTDSDGNREDLVLHIEYPCLAVRRTSLARRVVFSIMILMNIFSCQRLARLLRFSVHFAPALVLGFILPAPGNAAEKSSAAEAASRKVSYYHDIRPILQANCLGCHQPSKSKGGYVMTDFKKLLTGGDSEGVAIVPKQPGKSAILKMVTPQDGEVRMPKGKTPLEDSEVALLRSWIQQGAQDDTPADAKQHYDLQHPPVYWRPPVIASLDFSPDGKLLAVAGFHEVLLYEDNGATLCGRLIGLSERVQSLRFSPDGRWLGVAGGDPARAGEIQVWDVAKRKLALSTAISYDTLYGLSWSPDSKLIAFGCPDNTVRAIEATSGKQVMQMGSHSDWVMSTTFSVKGDYVISGGRDMSVKLTDIAEQRFVDNITSITPGALKGGVTALATHPKFEEMVAGGSDGLPKVYRIFREVKREIGDDAQFIADLFPITGRVFSVRFSADGKRIAYGGGLDRAGEVVVCSYDFTNEVPKALRAIMGKVPGNRKPEEQKQLDDYKKQGIHEIARAEVPHSEIYSVAFSPDGNVVAAGGSDGMVRLFNANNGSVIKEFLSVPLTKGALAAARPAWAPAPSKSMEPALTPEPLPEAGKIVALELQPEQIQIQSPNDYAQLLVTARLTSGDSVDVTRSVKFTMTPDLAAISSRGVFHPLKNGTGRLVAALDGKSAEIQVGIAGLGQPYHADFIRDVAPVIAELGCNAGTCHGAKEGKNGFKLSLRGYDPEADLRALTDDLASRRVNIASPDDSLMLLKSVAEVPHEGGRRTTVDSKYYQILRQWIANGATLDMKSPRVAKILVYPQDPVVQTIGARQQMRVVAGYSDGTTRDVTAEAFIASGNTDVAAAEQGGLITTLRRGEAPVLTRYEGNYATTILTVMGDRSGFVWKQPPTWGKIDELVAAKWQRMKIAPSGVCTDLEFIRRIYLDLTGLPPSPNQIEAFLSDSRPMRVKRDAMIDNLIGSDEYVDFWANKWSDLLQCNSKFLGAEGAALFHDWIHSQVEKNTPYDQFVREILTATGSNRENPAASYWKILRTPTEAMENTTQLFLATRFNCNKCHDHPFEHWTQDQYYHLAAYFARVSLKEDPKSEGRKIGGSDVESAQPLYEIVNDGTKGEVTHIRTGRISPPLLPYRAAHESSEKDTRREELAAWLTSPDNRFFASSYANRLWGYLTGVGIIEPLDDTRAGNPPRNPALLEYLSRQFVDSGFNARRLMQLICKSRTYQLSITPNQWNEDDKENYSHGMARRLPAETIFDAVFRVTGSTSEISGAKPGELATQLSDVTMDAGGGLLATLGRPARQSACECERSTELGLGPVMALLGGPTISAAIDGPSNSLAKLVATEKDNRKLINDVFLRVVNRPATEAETKSVIPLLSDVVKDNTIITNELGALEVKMAPKIVELRHQREDDIAKAKTNIGTYDEMTKNLRAQLDQSRQSELALTQRELKEYEKLLPAQAAFWETKNNPADTKTIWQLVKPQKISATGDVKLARQSDGSITASEGNSPSDYVIVAASPLTNITGVMLEVLPDENLPAFGPGRHKDGNFVLSELELKWAAGTNAPNMSAKFADARADYSQSDYPVKQAIDGTVETGRNGWAIKGAPNIQRHTATFKLEKPIASTNGAQLRFVLAQHYGTDYLLGRFRLYLTTSDDPLDFGLPENVVQAARAPAGERQPEQASAILDFYRNSDGDFWKRKQAVVNAAAPLAVDPKLTELQNALVQAQDPIRLDPGLVQLREDAKASGRQSKNKRLTVVQDLTWALINSPGFLFNH
jgi:WD40 repeat protein/mono/diheme cytochrome c family protein